MAGIELDVDSRNFDSSDKNWRPFLIGVAGGTASGKTTVCGKIMEKLGQENLEDHKRRVFCISQDSFYKPLTDEQRTKLSLGNYDFDHPDAIDDKLMEEVLLNILEMRVVQIPIWDFRTQSRKENEFITVYPADVILIEGILIFFFPQIRDLLHMKLFVDLDPDTRLSRRVIRDVEQLGRDLNTVLNQYTYFVKPAFEEFCLPTKKYADIIIPRGADNEVAIGLIVQTIREYLRNERPPQQNASNIPRTRYFSGSLISSSPPQECFLGSSTLTYNHSSPKKRPH